jgi:CHRD domain
MSRTSLLTAAISATCISAATAATIDYQATMNSKSEVPPTNSTGSGEVQATLNTDTKQLNYTMTYTGLTGPATAAHFHGPATAGENAGVALPIGKDPPSPSKGTVTLTDAQMNDLEAGKWYANIHTEANKAGEIRGQMVRGK